MTVEGDTDNDGGDGGDGGERWLQALELLLAEQRFRIERYAEAGSEAPAPPPKAPPGKPSRRPRTAPEPSASALSARELLKAVPLAAVVVRALPDARGAGAEYHCLAHNTAAWEDAGRRFPLVAASASSRPSRPAPPPPTAAASAAPAEGSWGEAVPLFEWFPALAATPVPRLLDAARRTGRPQGPEPAEWPHHAPDGRAVRSRVEVHVAPAGELLLLTWERGEPARARMARAAQQLARVAWAEWDLARGTVEEAGLRALLGLPAPAPLPDLPGLGRMVLPEPREQLYRALHDALLGERDHIDLELRLGPDAHNARVLRFLAEPVRAGSAPVRTVRAVCRDVTADVRARESAERALREARAQRERAEAVAEVAERLREAVLPGFPPELARHGLEAAVVYRPAGHAARVGGDWYKTRVLPTGRVLVALGDARGHGPDAVTLMAKLRYALAGLAFTGESVERLTGWLNLLTCDDGEESTATSVIAHYCSDRGLLRWTCAGHPPPLLVRRGGVRFLDPPPEGPGLPLGVLPGTPYTAAETPLRPGDVVLLYSDGLIERRGSDLDRDASRLLRAVRGGTGARIPPGGAALDAFARGLVDALMAPDAEDDATVLAFRRVEPGA
ncbi:serine/threonine-protein phosphatase [Streptomyces jietaisiensis]|uniref:PP2C family protein-serine/threonine phosphatase n=1 Tax=Streptomyces griseoaurantiacus TaxID=68213 RepID=UPI002E2ACF90|nr:PP2C family protein-serine/threonine phosphatase [Streptomyces jietaisiensis]